MLLCDPSRVCIDKERFIRQELRRRSFVWAVSDAANKGFAARLYLYEMSSVEAPGGSRIVEMTLISARVDGKIVGHCEQTRFGVVEQAVRREVPGEARFTGVSERSPTSASCR